MKTRRRRRWVLALACFLTVLFIAAPRPLLLTPQPLLQSQREIHLVVNFWAPQLKLTPHRDEVEAAIFSNLCNKHFHTVHILLEATHDFKCHQLKKRIEHHAERHNMSVQANMNCVHHPSRLVSYADMFRFARSLKDISSKQTLVTIANADMVFDETVSAVQPLRSDTVAVIATKGMPSGSYPEDVKSKYAILLGRKIKASINRCYDLAKEKRTSWDAFVFDPEHLYFNQTDFLDGKMRMPFTMNQNGAEEAALNAILKSSRFKCAKQLCEHVNIWHFHMEEKTHFNSSEEFVVHPYSWPEECDSLEACLASC